VNLERLLSIAHVREATSLNGVTIWRKYRLTERFPEPCPENSNPFPLPRYVGNRRVWRESDVQAWLEREWARSPAERRGARNLGRRRAS
jgi:predicted DNA-binding transcriptional regulator AlpA